jgi:hypothetical protein
MIETVQTCDKCNRSRAIDSGNQATRLNRDHGGWRLINDRDICNECITKFLEDTNAKVPTQAG